jgi:hypothetical protein
MQIDGEQGQVRGANLHAQRGGHHQGEGSHGVGDRYHMALEKWKGEAGGNDRIDQPRDVPLNQGDIEGRPINLE